MDYANPQTLFDALDNGDCATVKRCLRAGQNLNQPDSHSRTLLMRAFNPYNIPRIQTLLAFHKHVDLNFQSSDGTTALICAMIFKRYRTAHLLIQLGADVNRKIRSLYNAYSINLYRFSRGDCRNVKLMLLLAGVDPQEADRDVVIVKHAKRWISGLEYAKKRFQTIFDNEMLEKTVCEFIYTEEFLRKVL